MDAFDLDAYTSRSRALDLSDIPWEDVPRHPLPAEAIRTLRYMQDIESHTIVYLRSLLATRARPLSRRRRCRRRAAQPLAHTARRAPRGDGDRRAGTRLADFCVVHMTWGAINELTTLTGYRRLSTLAGHPILSEILGRIVVDESRHFFFYYRQAALRLQNPRAARIARVLVDRFWAPVGSGVQPKNETRCLAGYLFGGAEGRAAAQKVDEHIRRLPGFAGIALLEAWIDREVPAPRYAEPSGSAINMRSSSAVTA